MAPEQAKGRPVDRRADVWAFGVVFFEMLAGRRAFEGDDVSDVLASVLKMEPDWSALPADLPGPVRRLLRRCLEKDPKKRLRDVGEGMLQLEEGLASGSTSSIMVPAAGDAATMPAHAPPKPLWRRAIPIVATAALTTVALITMNAWTTVPPEPPALVRFVHEPPEGNPIGLSTNYRELAISPDGRTIVYAALDSTGRMDLWTRRLDQVEAAPVRGGETGSNPFVSPDNQWIGFVDPSDGLTVKKVPILGGPSVPIARLSGGMAGAAWTRDGSIIFGVRSQSLQIVKESGGEPVPLTTLDSDAGDVEHLWPAEVPGTSIILFVTGHGTSPALGGQLAAFDRASGRLVRFRLTGVQPKYVKTGHIVYASGDGSLRAVAFNPRTMEVSANPVPVLEGLGIKVTGAANYDVADDGRLAYLAGGDLLNANRTITWTNRAGKETPIPAEARNYYYARISPDGSRLSLDVRDQEQDIWIWDLRRETLSRLTVRPGADQYGLWTPASDRVVFNSAGGGKSELFQMRADGTGQVEQVSDSTKEKLSPFPNAITPDGKQVIFRAASSASRNDLWIVSLSGDRSVKPLLAKEHNEANATLSPDGKWMAYESDLTGRSEVYVRPFPDVETGQWPVSTGGGTEPLWSSKSGEIFYVSADQKLMSVRVSTANGFVADKPTALFDTKAYYFGGQGRNYDAAADGQRFVMVKEPPSIAVRSLPITVVLNWVEELRAKVK
jgi:serine/threonine-protein kinase